MWVTWLWTIIALVGVGAGVLSITEAMKDLSASRRVNGDAYAHTPRRYLAFSTVRAEALRMVTQLLFLLIGLGALSLDKNTVPPAWFRWLFTWGFVVGAFCIAANTVIGLYVRRRLRIMLEDLESPDASG